MENPSNMKFSPQDQQEILRFQKIQKQLELFTQQLTSMELQAKDMEQALNELEKANEDAIIYKAVGGLFIKKSKGELLESTRNAKENLELKIKSLKNNKNRIEAQFEEKRKKIEQIFKAQGYT
ncbi:MAG: prefoldin subunit beta [Candidatus Lokiarchaeota archaeon]|nr:prefoldin subunit beta [Candidatus Harpocratesius repetitus]